MRITDVNAQLRNKLTTINLLQLCQYSITVFFPDYADCLAEVGRLKDSLSVLCQTFMSASVPMERLKPFVEALCDLSQSDAEPVSSADPWSCPTCYGVLNNPICIPCGHSYCQKCLEKDPDGVCKKCGVRWRWRETKLKDMHVTVLINNLCQKYWSDELNAIDLRNKGNKFFQSGSVERALEIYDKAFQLGKWQWYNWRSAVS